MFTLRVQSVGIDVGDLTREVAQKAKARTPGLALRVRELLHKELMESEVVTALTGPLFGQVGIPTIIPQLKTIIEHILTTIQVGVEFTPTEVYFTLLVLPGGLEELLQIPDASFAYYSIRQRQQIVLPWLEWLSTAQSPLIFGYHFVPKSTPSSRTGQGVMVRRGTWDLPSSLKLNWIPDALREVEFALEELFAEAMGEV